MATYTSGSYTLVGVLSNPITAETSSNQTVTYNIAGLLDTFNIQSDTGATTTVNQSVSLADTLNLTAAGGSLVLGTGVAGVDTVNATLTNGGSLVAGGTLASLLNGGTITFSTGGGTLVVGTAGTLVALSLGSEAIKGFTNSTDIIDSRSLNFSTITGYSVTGTGTGTQTVTVADSSGNFSFTTSAANLANGTYTSANLNGGTLKFSADGTGGTFLTVCFLRSTCFATPDGERAVEDLRAGDLVATRRDGAVVFEPIRWVGVGRMGKARKVEDYPVRVRAGAFRDNVPHRDLLVTSEHCLFVDGNLIPARMLVNGRSIVIDDTITEYEYFHVELDAHSILLAEGLETESYLDTGNRGNFSNNIVSNIKPDFTINSGHKSWESHAAAPLVVAREQVEPIWKRLDARATSSGLAARHVEARMTDKPDLRLRTQNGLEIAPILAVGHVYTFVVLNNSSMLRLVSRSSRPSEIVGPFLDDRRDLGVLVGKISISDGRRRIVSETHLTSIPLAGWHDMEDQAAYRWTNGDAVLPLDLSIAEGRPVFLEIEVVSAGPYLEVPLVA